ncbi:discoidin, CUB and LCCL domain-containing protein 1 isoform X2 [Syngnathus scovelli]|uniref:discoidin, CUB and LCCL domain-containing protein 1 isoform X2 n=1 Tax=Syngnathus scovelli TaxID=161590 RepID=UPI0021106F89|nr:discoidin, CUB and LCCL domain-containing protein 1 isoform X2 [Syngnathus scovelli]
MIDSANGPIASQVSASWPIVNTQYFLLQLFLSGESRTHSRAFRGSRFICLHGAVEIMRTKCENIRDALKSLLVGYCLAFCALSKHVHGQEGDGCGHTHLGTESGTLASQNYPGTYPSHTWCKWKLRVPEGRTLRLIFGDFDIESSPNCSNGSLVITDKNGHPSLGPVCGRLNASQKNITLTSNEVTITFKSKSHLSGRGFLLSYATDLYPDIISCLQRGSHFSSPHVRVYCPAGCKNVTGDIWGGPEQGYRDTSVLCKSAVHAGATSDSLGGRVNVSRRRSLTRYESTFSNGIFSKTGSLSEKKLVFVQECNNILAVYGSNASSFADKLSWSSRKVHSGHEGLVWTADWNDPSPWVELGLTDKSSITGVITTASGENHINAYTLLFSRDRTNWKLYKDAVSKEGKVFEAFADGQARVLNSLYPPPVARFIRVRPQRYHGRPSARVQILGCPVKVTPRSRSPDESTFSKANEATPNTSPTPTEGPVLVASKQRSSQPVIIAVGVVLGLITCFGCLLAGVWWKRRKKASQIKYSVPTSCQSFQIKTLPCPPSELISYPLERNIHDALRSPPLNDYAQPATGQKVGSTFRPSSDEGYTIPFTFSQYNPSGNMPEYAEPLPPEPEYATPFGEQECAPSAGGTHCNTGRQQTSSIEPPGNYDCPSHRMLDNGYCTPALHANTLRPYSVVYAEPKSCYSSLQRYEEPL